MKPIIIDPSLYCQFEDEEFVRINGSNVDDRLRAGTDESQTHSDATLGRFGTTENQQAPLTLAGMHITESENMYHIDQDSCMRNIEQIPSDAEFRKLCSMRKKLAWLKTQDSI